MVEVGVARVVVRLETASGRVGRVGLDPAGRRTDSANTAANTVAPQLLAPLPAEVRYILGDTHYNDPEVRALCERANRALVATRRGAYPHRDAGVECDASSISCVPRPLNRSMACSKTCLSGVPRCRETYGVHSCWRWVPLSFISWCCSINTSTISHWARGSSPS